MLVTPQASLCAGLHGLSLFLPPPPIPGAALWIPQETTMRARPHLIALCRALNDLKTESLQVQSKGLKISRTEKQASFSFFSKKKVEGPLQCNFSQLHTILLFGHRCTGKCCRMGAAA